MAAEENVIRSLRRYAYSIQRRPDDLEPLIDRLGECRVVLLGEASHGTHEFYNLRAELTRQLIEVEGFNAVAVEADWPDAYRVNRYVQGRGKDATAAEALSDFRRFPTWMWRNADVLNFVGWLREYNDIRVDPDAKVGFYGLDLYSLNTSIREVIHYLEKVDPDAARQARHQYSCFDHYGEDPQSYGYTAGLDLSETCEKEVLAVLADLRRGAQEYLRRDGFIARDEFFYAEQNARLAKDAEQYYRSMFGGRISSWNLRDGHMFETLQALVRHLENQGIAPKVVVWAHNSHIGDARQTDVSRSGELNVGQLVREAYGRDAGLVGFTTYEGTVTAASDWDAPVERQTVRPALEGSFEFLFHHVLIPDFFLLLGETGDMEQELAKSRLERAIGVVYLPETERVSHYFYANLSRQFDAVIHLDHTRAVEPLERTAVWEEGEVPETYPSAL